MTSNRSTRQGPAIDRRRIGAWENEGGHLAGDRADAEPLVHVDATTPWTRAVPLADLADESAMHLDLAGVPICLARSGGTFHALLDECSHGQVALSDGEVEDGVVECWLHGSCFDLVTGVPTGPPALVAVPVFPVRVVDDVVEVAVQRTKALRAPTQMA